MFVRAHISSPAQLARMCAIALASGTSSFALAAAPPPPPINLPEPAKPVDPAEKIEDASQVRPEFDRLVEGLGSPDFAIRQRASDRLSANEQFTLEMLEASLSRKDLSLEARYRLFTIARQRFYRSPRAALGFRFGDQLRDRAVVGETFPPFPAAKVLEVGDMIVRADGLKLDGPAARPLLQSIIVSHDPGENLHVVIRRGARKIEMDVPLGKFTDLGQGGGPLDEQRLARAWRLRSQARMGGLAEPIRVEGMPANWSSAPTSPDEAQRRIELAMRRDANDAPLRFAGGGMPRGAMLNDDARLFEQVIRPQVMVINGQARIVNMPVFRNGMGGFGGLNDWDPDSGLMAIKPERELADLNDMRQTLTRQLAGVDPDALPLGDPHRTEYLEVQKKIALITKQFDAIQAERDEALAAKPKPAVPPTVDANAPPVP